MESKATPLPNDWIDGEVGYCRPFLTHGHASEPRL